MILSKHYIIKFILICCSTIPAVSQAAKKQCDYDYDWQNFYLEDCLVFAERGIVHNQGDYMGRACANGDMDFFKFHIGLQEGTYQAEHKTGHALLQTLGYKVRTTKVNFRRESAHINHTKRTTYDLGTYELAQPQGVENLKLWIEHYANILGFHRLSNNNMEAKIQISPDPACVNEYCVTTVVDVTAVPADAAVIDLQSSAFAGKGIFRMQIRRGQKLIVRMIDNIETLTIEHKRIEVVYEDGSRCTNYNDVLWLFPSLKSLSITSVGDGTDGELEDGGPAISIWAPKAAATFNSFAHHGTVYVEHLNATNYQTNWGCFSVAADITNSQTQLLNSHIKPTKDQVVEFIGCENPLKRRCI